MVEAVLVQTRHVQYTENIYANYRGTWYLYDIAVGKYESIVDCLRGRSETCNNTLSTSTSVENNNPCFCFHLLASAL